MEKQKQSQYNPLKEKGSKNKVVIKRGVAYGFNETSPHPERERSGR